jgi:hypothetical protein
MKRPALRSIPAAFWPATQKGPRRADVAAILEAMDLLEQSVDSKNGHLLQRASTAACGKRKPRQRQTASTLLHPNVSRSPNPRFNKEVSFTPRYNRPTGIMHLLRLTKHLLAKICRSSMSPYKRRERRRRPWPSHCASVRSTLAARRKSCEAHCEDLTGPPKPSNEIKVDVSSQDKPCYADRLPSANEDDLLVWRQRCMGPSG